MNILDTPLKGVKVIEPKVFFDERGFFLESYNKKTLEDHGIKINFLQDNHSKSARGVLRGLHFQSENPQGKLVRCLKGEILDVVVDINPKSLNFKNFYAVSLSDQNFKQIWIPAGYAHGFCVTSEFAEIQYKCDSYYCPDDQAGIIWNDPSISINWPVKEPILSPKDRSLPKLNEISL